MAKVIDGWHKLCGYDVYIEGGFVIRGVSGGESPRPVYPYRKSRYGGWDLEKRLTEAAFRAGVRRGTITML